MIRLTPKIFKNMIRNNANDICTSIYISVNNKKPNTLAIKDEQIKLKNSVKKIIQQLKDSGISKNDAESEITLLSGIENNSEIISDPREGLALFSNAKNLYYIKLPINVPETALALNNYYIIPIIPWLSHRKKFFLLTLSLNNARLYSYSDYELREEKDLFSAEATSEVSLLREKQKSLQFRTGQEGSGKALFHGQGRNKDEKQLLAEKILRIVNRQLMQYLEGHNEPLLIAAVDSVFSIFKSFSDYEHIYQTNLGGNYDEKSQNDLKKEAVKHMENYFNEGKNTALASYPEKAGKNVTSTAITNILQSGIEGKIDHLFIKKGEYYWGKFDAENKKVYLDEQQKPDNNCLLNEACLLSLLNGGNVYLAEEEEMPEKNIQVCAIYRY